MKRVVFCLIVISALSSCNLYKPGRANVPILEGKNDGNLSVSGGRNFGVEASYSPVNHLGIIANYTNGYKDLEYRTYENSERSIVNQYNNQQYEFGLGYYIRIDTLHYFEIYAGYGIGESGVVGALDGFFSTDQIAFEAMHEQMFIQPTIAYEFNQSSSIRFSAKLAAITFYDINYSPYFPQSDRYSFDRTFTSVQPSVTLLKKNEFIDFSWQLGLYLSPQKGFYTNRWLNTSLALGINLGRLRQSMKARGQ